MVIGGVYLFAGDKITLASDICWALFIFPLVCEIIILHSLITEIIVLPLCLFLSLRHTVNLQEPVSAVIIHDRVVLCPLWPWELTFSLIYHTWFSDNFHDQAAALHVSDDNLTTNDSLPGPSQKCTPFLLLINFATARPKSVKFFLLFSFAYSNSFAYLNLAW